MSVSAKCYYALRAIYALAEHQGSVPLKANEITERQHIPINPEEAPCKGLGNPQSSFTEANPGITRAGA